MSKPILFLLNILVYLRLTLGNHVYSCTDNINSPCKQDWDCAANDVHCIGGVCQCEHEASLELDILPNNKSRWICNPLPTGGQNCTSVCAKPYTCVENAKTNSKTCICKEPAVEKSGYCVLECKKDEIYTHKGECEKRCEGNEILSEKRGCKKLSAIKEPCETHFQCTVAFSHCRNKKCECKRGFSWNEKNGKCETQEYSCPTGDPIRKHGKIIECQVQQKSSWDSSNIVDPCGNGQFCMLYRTYDVYAGTDIGHCCPLPKPTCPVGEPLLNTTCGFNDGPVEKGVVKQQCPRSHRCLERKLGAGYKRTVCCPKACDEISRNGRCYETVDYGDVCQLDSQCRQHDGICEKGKCTCGKSQKTISRGDSTSCSLDCAYNEMRVRNTCMKKIKLGDTCSKQGWTTYECPVNAFCSDEKKCVCNCEYLQLSDTVCAPAADCNDITSAPISDWLPKKNVNAAKSHVYCRLPDAKTPTDIKVLDKCPADQKCVTYSAYEGLGLCCTEK